MLKLPNVTLIALTSVRIPETIKALEYSCRNIEFGKVKLASNIKPENLPDFIIQFLNFMPNNVLRQISSITTISIFLFTCEVSIINLHSMIIFYRYI